MKIISFTFITATALLCGCGLTDKDGKHNAFTPMPMFIRNIPDGDDSYSQGFRDGCNDSLGVSGFGMPGLHAWKYSGEILTPIQLRVRHNPRRSLNDNQYNIAYSDAFYYCGLAANAAVGF